MASIVAVFYLDGVFFGLGMVVAPLGGVGMVLGIICCVRKEIRRLTAPTVCPKSDYAS